MKNKNVNITENRIKDAGKDASTANNKVNNWEDDRKVIEENSGTIYSVSDVWDVGAKHHGVNASVRDIQNNNNKSSKGNKSTKM